jgi:hypothetical protein
MNELKVFLLVQGAALMIFLGTLLPSLYTTPSYQDHYRSITWIILVFWGIIFFTWFVSFLPFDKGITPFIAGLVVGSNISLFIDNLSNGVENYWMIGQAYTCLPDFVIVFGVAFLILRFSIHAKRNIFNEKV